ncbi:MAG: 16S rRNA (adenine(1518)-N(6)/adenine(1519)-N(6))-dimethyltransferase RsmA [Candidatus Gorgyraea atricola]|nr:16S rRNA (adenine(1518)-N(6)/adenine(1519)-N(6))-dimethyltransferase RsmA [Candidatus Gorgyraea atricola]
MLSLREVKCALHEYNIRPSKRFGQNFLIDKNIQRKIIASAHIEKKDTVLEIGPGLGALTSGLCEAASKVIAVEKDKRLHEFLSRNSSFENLELIQGDALQHDFSKYSKIRVLGNLPYYISSPILIYLLKNRSFMSSIFITVQREFAERLVAKPGTRDYGSISCFTQFYAEPEILFKIKKTAFYPMPKVDSCFLKVVIRNQGLCLTDEEKLFKIIRSSFEKRRKTVLNSLAASGEFGSKQELSEKLSEAGISPNRRPETISLDEFVKLVAVTK